MVQVLSALLFTAAFAVSLGMLAVMLGSEWRRVAGILIGDRKLSRGVVPAPRPIRLQGRRWQAAPGPSRSMLLRAAA